MKTLLIPILIAALSSLALADQGGDDPIEGIDVIIKRDPASKPIANPGRDPLVHQINKIEHEYMRLIANQIRRSLVVEKGLKKDRKSSLLKAYKYSLEATIKKHTATNGNSNKSGGVYCRFCGDARSSGCSCPPPGPIPGIDDVIPLHQKGDDSFKPIANPKKDPLIEKINKLEMHYLNLRAKQIQNGFASSKEAKAAKSKDAVFKAYIAHLQKEIMKLQVRKVDRSKILRKGQKTR